MHMLQSCTQYAFVFSVMHVLQMFHVVLDVADVTVALSVVNQFTFLSCYSVSWLCTDLYEYCLRENIADKNLIAKWKKPGYENVCCLQCIQKQDTNFGTNCICRVPKTKLEEV